MLKGKLIVIEAGTDASGKETQTKMLYDRLIKEGYNVKKVSFPSYQEEYSALVRMYLNGEFGKNPNDVDCYVASTFYAVDRYASYKTNWGEFYEEGGIVLCDRYTTSNMVHQAAKLDTSEREKFLNWLWEFEYTLYKLPQPDEVFFLDVIPEVSQKLMQNRLNKITGEAKKDIHESDKAYLEKSYYNALYVADKYKWTKINCAPSGEMLDRETIHEEIWSQFIKTLK